MSRALPLVAVLAMLVPTTAAVAKSKSRLTTRNVANVQLRYGPQWKVTREQTEGKHRSVSLARKAGDATILVVVMVQPKAPADPKFDKEPEHAALAFAYSFAKAAAKNPKGDGAMGGYGRIDVGGKTTPSYRLFMPLGFKAEHVLSVEAGARRMGTSVVLGAVATFGTVGGVNSKSDYLLAVRDAYRMLDRVKVR